MKNAIISTATIVDPTGVPATMEVRIPIKAQQTDRIAEQIVTDLKLLNRRIADIAGEMIRAEISRDPTRFMARTMMTAVMTAITRL